MVKNGEEYFEAAADVISTRPKINGFCACPCCGRFSLGEVGSYEICEVCNWEDDPVQEANPTLSEGANKVSLVDAKENFKRHGHCYGPTKTRILP